MKKYLSLLLFLFVFLIGCNEVKTTYTITYDLNGGEATGLIESFESGDAVKLVIPTKEGFEFIGWYQDEQKITVIEDKNYNLIANWKVIEYTIVYDLDGGSCSNLIETFKHNDEVTLPIPTKEGHLFKGWYQEDSLVESITNQNYNLKAKWEVEDVAKSYNVKIYFQNKLIFNDKVLEGTKILDIDLSKAIEAKFNYEIKEVYTDKSFDNSISTRSKVIEDLELYVVIKLKPKIEDYKNLKISILGDSISTFYKAGSEVNSYYSGENTFYYPRYCSVISSYQKTWWWKVIEGLEGNIGINNSWSGTCVYNWGSETNSSAMNMHRIKTLGENGAPDIIIVNMGTNDAVSNFTDPIFKTAYDTMLSRIEKEYPNAYIFVFTLGYSIYEGYDPVRLRYNKVIEELSNKHHAPIVDIAYIQTVDTYVTMLADRLHPNEEGMTKISERALSTIKGFFTSGKEYK